MKDKRFDILLARVDAWAAELPMYYDRGEVVAELDFLLKEGEYQSWSDEQIFDQLCAVAESLS